MARGLIFVSPVKCSPENEQRKNTEKNPTVADGGLEASSNPFKPMLLTLSAFGIVPASLHRPPTMNARTCCSILYIVLLTTLICASSVLVLHESTVSILAEKCSTYSKMRSISWALFVIPNFYIIFIWFEVSRFAKADANFKKYEAHFKEITCHELIWKQCYKTNKKMLVKFLFAGLFPILEKVTGEVTHFTLASIPACLSGVLLQTCLLLWYMTPMTQTRLAAKALLSYLKTAPPSPPLLTSHIHRARGLWIELREEREARSAPSNWILVVLNVYLSITATYHLYRVPLSIRLGFIRSAMKQAAISGLAFSQIYLLCNEAHGCTSQINDPFVIALDRLSLGVRDQRTLMQLHLFYLSITAKPSVPSLGGFATYNRTFISSVVSMIVTYLIVLLQFDRF